MGRQPAGTWLQQGYSSWLHRYNLFNLHSSRITLPAYGRGAGVSRGLGVGVHLPVHGVGVGVGVGDAVGVGVEVGVGVAVGVGDAVGVKVGVGLGGGPDCAQYLPPVLVTMSVEIVPPQTIISLPVHTAVWNARPIGAFVVLVGIQAPMLGVYRPPVFS